ncbi:hypothetical protein FHS27_002002 [Rhodopirellula rubra]|uniref:Macro domain-containing protein n=1 Tax=Aporhodopirellula rubra TaxID=980271 RepID=A0A7W5DXS5_9BACT|nr:hypothetical protein [Aporhodopirellula rubra]MBB3206194.1 hypothetical protein [Aporhodopirellula rubra]
MTWFHRLTGVDENTPDQVRQELQIEDGRLVCPNGNRFCFGRLETPKLSELRNAVEHIEPIGRPSTIREVVADVRTLHCDRRNENALFQVASQFNLLEMTGPSVTPERGVGIYEADPTQGPACAIACGAGTIYRNYFVPVDGSVGQSMDKQIDCSSDLGLHLGNQTGEKWTMRNGYLLPTVEGLHQTTRRLEEATETELDELRGELRIGLQWQTDVTLADATHKVSQAYCSALPVAYGCGATDQWSPFAQLILDAAYEATLCAGVLNAAQTGVNTIYLTLLGGGVFGNRDSWITRAIERACYKLPGRGLDLRCVSVVLSNPEVSDLVDRLNANMI